MTEDDRVMFLRRSLADLDREHDAEDLTDADYAQLRAEYEERLAAAMSPDAPEVDASIADATAAAGPGAATPPGRRQLSTVALSAVFLVVVALTAGFLVARSTGRREGGQTLSGNAQSEVVVTTTTLPANLARCAEVEGGDAIDCYTAYTQGAPEDPLGWTEFGLFAIRSGIANGNDELIGAGESFLGEALDVDPGYVPARVQLATVYLRMGRTDEARAELSRLEGATIPPDLLPLVDVLRDELAGSATTTGP